MLPALACIHQNQPCKSEQSEIHKASPAGRQAWHISLLFNTELLSELVSDSLWSGSRWQMVQITPSIPAPAVTPYMCLAAAEADASHSSKRPLDPAGNDSSSDTSQGPPGMQDAGAPASNLDMPGELEAGKLPPQASDDMTVQEKRALKQEAYANNLQEERAVKISRSNRIVLGMRSISWVLVAWDSVCWRKALHQARLCLISTLSDCA